MSEKDIFLSDLLMKYDYSHFTRFFVIILLEVQHVSETQEQFYGQRHRSANGKIPSCQISRRALLCY